MSRRAIAEVERAELDWNVSSALDPARTAPGAEVARLLKVAREAIDGSCSEDEINTLRDEVDDLEVEKGELEAELAHAESEIRRLNKVVAQLRWELEPRP